MRVDTVSDRRLVTYWSRGEQAAVAGRRLVGSARCKSKRRAPGRMPGACGWRADARASKGKGSQARGSECARARGREGVRAREREGARARGREGVTAREREGARARGREGARARGREGARARGHECASVRVYESASMRVCNLNGDTPGCDTPGRRRLCDVGQSSLKKNGARR